jgi:hypothetical protein
VQSWRIFAVSLLVPLGGCLQAQGQETSVAVHEALLRPDRYPELVVEIAAAPGREPDRGVLEEVHQTLLELTGRSRMTFVATLPIPEQGGSYTYRDLQRIHAATAVTLTGPSVQPGRVHLHVLFLDGRMAAEKDGDGGILGTSAVGLIVVFPDEFAHAYRWEDDVRTSARPIMERHVLLHELGHALGLVGRGVPMVRDHMDRDHPGHSSNPLSLMHALPPMTPEGFVYARPRTFDEDDLADLAAFRLQVP